MDLFSVEYQLNKMKAETLGEAGQKLEIVSKIISSEISYQRRIKKIIERINRDISFQKRFKRKQWKAIKERGMERISRSESYVRQLLRQHKHIFDNYIIQREALGLTDHSWIEDFYGHLLDDVKEL